MTGDELKSELARLGLSRRHLALIARVHEVTVANWCCGKHEAPEMLRAVLAAYEIVPTAKRRLLFPKEMI